jgi:Protein of unknown function DUF262
MNVSEQVDNLQTEIDKKRQEIRSDSYSMSIGEWISLYQQGDVEIHPEFQRFFRWSDYQKTSLIESILLGIPIPPVFVSQREDGIWDVVDGLQRLSTIYQFAGILKDDKGKLVPPLVLEKTKYLPSLSGKQWEDKENPDNPQAFTQTQRLLIKRSKIDINILQKESDPSAKYELFQRLKTGGSLATYQEIRSCILVSLNPDFYQWMRDLSENENFQLCIGLPDASLAEQYDLEILSRFLVLRTIEERDLQGIVDVETFVTDKIQEISRNPNYDLEEEKLAFERTFDLLATCMGSDSFKKYDPRTEKFSRGFMLAPFETIALGIAYNYQQYRHPYSDVKHKVVEMWSDSQYTSAFGRGKYAQIRLQKLIPLGRKLFAI